MTDSAGLHQHHIARILAFLAQHRLPGMFQATENVEAGGFMAYGASLPAMSKGGLAETPFVDDEPMSDQ
jgi:hypothetical protein